jgi:hypothetical protein
MAQQSLVGQGLLIIDASRSRSDTPHSVGLLWTSDQPDTEISSCSKHTTFTTDKTSRFPAGFEPVTASGRRPTPYTARPMGWTLTTFSFTDDDDDYYYYYFFFFVLRMVALHSSLTSVTIHQSKRRYAPENWNRIQ